MLNLTRPLRQSANDYGGVISVFGEQARRGDPLTIHGDGTQTRDCVHVSDVVAANLAAANADAVGEASNVGTGTRTSVPDLAETIREVTGTDSPITYTEPRVGDGKHSCPDVGKAREHLGYRPSVELADGLASLLSWGAETAD